ncbi:MAG: pilus assembly protein PilM [Planctomycetes bacterium]|nr:pilus assembly protein PilM [Planctomycetota bacterium]
MGKAIGLDIGSQWVKLVEVEGSPKKWRVSRFVHREIPPGAGPEASSAAVGEVLREARARREAVAPALSSKAVVMREIMVPFLEPDAIRKVIRFEAEAHLHNYAIEDVVIDFLKTGEARDQAKVLVFAAPKTAIRQRLEMLKANGVDPMHLNLDLAALYTAARSCGAFTEHPNAVVLDLGASTTNLLFVMNGELASCRSLRSGTEALVRVLARDLAVDTDSAREQAKQGDGSPRPGDLLESLALEPEGLPDGEKTVAEITSAITLGRQDDFIVRIHREVTRTLASWPMDAALTAVYVTGGASLAPGVVDRLAERFRKPVLRLPFIAGDTRAVPAADIEMANAVAGIALGCALTQLGAPGLRLEFRREDLRYTRKFDLVKVALASTVSLVFILLFLVWLHTQHTLRVRQSEFQNVLSLLDSTYIDKTRAKYDEVLGDMGKKDLGPKGEEQPRDHFVRLSLWESQIRKMHVHITTEMGFNVQGIPPIRSALAIWRDLSDRFGESRFRAQMGYFWVDEIRITQKLVSVDGKLGKRDVYDLIGNELARIEYVDKVIRETTETEPEGGKTRFGINAELKPMAIQKADPAAGGGN